MCGGRRGVRPSRRGPALWGGEIPMREGGERRGPSPSPLYQRTTVTHGGGGVQEWCRQPRRRGVSPVVSDDHMKKKNFVWSKFWPNSPRIEDCPFQCPGKEGGWPLWTSFPPPLPSNQGGRKALNRRPGGGDGPRTECSIPSEGSKEQDPGTCCVRVRRPPAGPAPVRWGGGGGGGTAALPIPL